MSASLIRVEFFTLIPTYIRHITVFACFVVAGWATVANAADSPKKPHQVIADLQQRMYVIGETTGRFSDFVEAERKAAADIRIYVGSGDATSLTEKNGTGQTPLIAAAFMGYAELISELLKSNDVRNSINDVDPKGMSAWTYANVALRQSMWLCNPTVLKNPFVFVPLFVTQPYYLTSVENPYRKTRRLLEEAGAKADREQAKRIWHDNCKLQDERVRMKVNESNDLLETVLAEGTVVLARVIGDQQPKKNNEVDVTRFATVRIEAEAKTDGATEMPHLTRSSGIPNVDIAAYKIVKSRNFSSYVKDNDTGKKVIAISLEFDLKGEVPALSNMTVNEVSPRAPALLPKR